MVRALAIHCAFQCCKANANIPQLAKIKKVHSRFISAVMSSITVAQTETKKNHIYHSKFLSSQILFRSSIRTFIKKNQNLTTNETFVLSKGTVRVEVAHFALVDAAARVFTVEGFSTRWMQVLVLIICIAETTTVGFSNKQMNSLMCS